MAAHELKTLPAYFAAIERGEKTFEIRRDDRGFQKGDVVVLWEYNPSDGLFKKPSNSRKLHAKIGWVLTGGQFGLEPGYVAFSLKDVRLMD